MEKKVADAVPVDALSYLDNHNKRNSIPPAQGGC